MKYSKAVSRILQLSIDNNQRNRRQNIQSKSFCLLRAIILIKLEARLSADENSRSIEFTWERQHTHTCAPACMLHPLFQKWLYSK